MERRLALRLGVLHLMLAGVFAFAATWTALRWADAPCVDPASCVIVNVAVVGLNLFGYLVASSVWLVLLHRSLGRVSPRAPRRMASAGIAQLLGGATAIVGGAAVGGLWSLVGLVAAVLVVPTIVVWWVASRPDVVPWWRRPGW